MFIDPGNKVHAASGNPHGIGRGMDDWNLIHEPYLENFSEFVRRVAERRVYVLPTLDLFPQNAHYHTNIVGSVDARKIECKWKSPAAASVIDTTPAGMTTNSLGTGRSGRIGLRRGMQLPHR
ncbi:hypothetical protein ACTMTF_20460 [Nonomuraea sp. ZG12]|uniref:hypothetical protein n=1 Tax=Nonomuraea sp. ZG12 TaxID=3452207 RepID=UPI003F898FDC